MAFPDPLPTLHGSRRGLLPSCSPSPSERYLPGTSPQSPQNLLATLKQKTWGHDVPISACLQMSISREDLAVAPGPSPWLGPPES